MLRLFILTTALAVTVVGQNGRSYSAASESQRRFAIENRYDDTGPGAKGPEYAYNTYRTLEEALVSYVDDADTKLPQQERAKLERYLNIDFSQPIRELPKTVEEYTGLIQPTRQTMRPFQPQIRQPLHPRPIMQTQEVQPQPQILRQPQPILPQQEPISYQPVYKYTPERLFFQDPSSKYSFLDFRGSDLRQKLQGEQLESFGTQGVQAVNVPLNQGVYSTELGLNDGQYDHHPQYTYSYGVHDKKTGDSKSAHESRNGGSVKGYYTFIDPDGKQRTVHYTADDQFGFRATVQRTNMNTQ